MSGRRRAPVLAIVSLVAALSTAAAEDKPPPTYTVDGSVTTGYRFVDVGGSTSKYREDYNLNEGPVLFGLSVDGLSHAPDKTPVDRFHLEVDTPGNEPVSFFRLSAADRETYDLRVDFTRSKYFYAVPQLWEQPVAGDVRLDDLHDFNTTRTNGAVDLTVHAAHLPTLLFGYRLYELTGDATSTMRIQNGDTFLTNAPVDSVTHVGKLGTEFRLLGTDFFLQQEYRRVSRSFDQQAPLPGGAIGLDPTDPSTLQSWTSHEDEHLDIPATTVRLRHPIGDDVDLTGDYFYSHADLGFHGGRRRVGTSDTPAFSGVEVLTDNGGATMDTHVADLAATWRARDWLRFDASWRYNERSEGGDVREPSTFGLLAAATGDQVRVHSLTGDVEVDPRKDLSLRAGVRWAHRDANFSQSAQQKTSTDAIGAIADATYHPWTFADLYLRYEGAQVDDPLVTPGDPTAAIPAREITLTFVNRGNTGLRLRLRDWLSVQYQLVAESRENGSFGARSQNFGNSVGLSIQPLATLSFYASYTRRDVDNRADILLAPLYTRTRSLQRGTEDMFTTDLRYDFTAAKQQFSLGGNVAYVNASNALAPRFEPGMQGLAFFDLNRVDGGAFFTWHHPFLEPSIEFRRIDYTERVLPGNDYRATIVALKIRKAFSFGF